MSAYAVPEGATKDEIECDSGLPSALARQKDGRSIAGRVVSSSIVFHTSFPSEAAGRPFRSSPEVDCMKVGSDNDEEDLFECNVQKHPFPADQTNGQRTIMTANQQPMTLFAPKQRGGIKRALFDFRARSGFQRECAFQKGTCLRRVGSRAQSKEGRVGALISCLCKDWEWDDVQTLFQWAFNSREYADARSVSPCSQPL